MVENALRLAVVGRGANLDAVNVDKHPLEGEDVDETIAGHDDVDGIGGGGYHRGHGLLLQPTHGSRVEPETRLHNPLGATTSACRCDIARSASNRGGALCAPSTAPIGVPNRVRGTACAV